MSKRLLLSIILIETSLLAFLLRNVRIQANHLNELVVRIEEAQDEESALKKDRDETIILTEKLAVETSITQKEANKYMKNLEACRNGE